MPPTQVFFYQDSNGCSPVVEWMEELQRSDTDAFDKCTAIIERLEECGYELRRPTADILRDGIRELRFKKGHVHYRLLYFFHGKNVAILAHALTKEDVVPVADIARAIRRKELFESAPSIHTYQED